MTVWINTDFQGHWPVGTSAVIVAESKKQAAELLEAELARVGLSQKVDPQSMVEICLTVPGALILQDGDY
jgi:hypothetical protein